MTILLPVDAAYAFDYLAILQIKRDNGLPVHDDLTRVWKALSNQVFEIEEILRSDEFRLMTKTNQDTFEAIECAHKDKIGAREVQEINYRRYEAKRALQQRFWPSQPLTEQKTKL